MSEVKRGATHTVSIGMPVYNGAAHIQEALESVVRQGFTAWHLTVSDNASTDATRSIVESFSQHDARISYVRHETNLGAVGNFVFLLRNAEASGFIWIACDDVWHEDFLEACVGALESDAEAVLAFTNMRNIDEAGKECRSYPSFSRLIDLDPRVSLVKYSLDPEYLGKANLLYGLMRRASVQEYVLRYMTSPVAACYATDAVMVLGLLCRGRLALDERMLFSKRLSHDELREARRHGVRTDPYLSGIVPWEEMGRHAEAVSFATSGTGCEGLVSAVTDYRARLSRDIHSAKTDSMRKFVKATTANARVFARAVYRKMRHGRNRKKG